MFLNLFRRCILFLDSISGFLRTYNGKVWLNFNKEYLFLSFMLIYFLFRLGTTPLMLAVFIGAAQNILSKGAKYSLFDPCKEMAYIPLGMAARNSFYEYLFDNYVHIVGPYRFRVKDKG